MKCNIKPCDRLEFDMRAKTTQRRRDELAEVLLRDGHINASEQAALFGVSHETIRKDIIYLENIGLARKGYGGAVVSPEEAEQSFSEKYVENQDQKRRIAVAARACIEEGDAILLDSGSTVYALARLLCVQPAGVTVFTNSLKAAQLLQEGGVHTYLLGGRVRASSGAVTGTWALEQLSQIRVQKAFLGTSGFARRQGPCIESFEEAQIKQAMMACAQQKILLGDSGKARRSTLIQYACWQELDMMITDRGLDEETGKEIAQHVRVMTV